MYIDIDKDLVPYSFDMELDGEMFNFEVNYNERFDFFTITLSKDGEAIVYGEKLMLNKPLFASISDERLPKSYIIPLDESQDENRITFDNLGKTIFLFVGEDTE